MNLEVLAPVKVNLFLEVRERRADGFHEIVTVMEALEFGDMVRVSAAPRLEVQTDRKDVPEGEGNLAWKIIRAAESELGRELPAAIFIQKKLAPGTGLGAGSSDAVAALRGVLQLHGLSLSPERMQAIAARVGSDTAFFVRGGVATCTGRGEVVAPVAAKGVRHYVLLLSRVSTETAAVYRALEIVPHQEGPARLLMALSDGSALCEAMLFNRLSAAAFSVAPELGGLQAEARAMAWRTPQLSGSGGSLFFLAKDKADADLLVTTLNVRGDWHALAVHSRAPELP
jgi:4-diphosphocytidyl-2-C-methyl-D-erythritol kinase